MGISDRISSKFDIILASSSPRRYEILHDVMGFKEIQLMKPSFEENLDKSAYKSNPIGYVCDTARCKAEGILKDLNSRNETGKEKLVICADTVVIDSHDVIYEKPKSKDIQLTNLKKFCYSDVGKPLRVVTAVTLIRWTNADHYTVIDPFFETTEVQCDQNIPFQLLEEYVESGDGLAVAGGFKIQGLSGMIIKKIDGDYYNVVGLPLNSTFQAIYGQFCK